MNRLIIKQKSPLACKFQDRKKVFFIHFLLFSFIKNKFSSYLDLKKSLLIQSKLKSQKNEAKEENEYKSIIENEKTENAANSTVEISEANSKIGVISSKSKSVSKSLKKVLKANSSSESKEIAEADNFPKLPSDNLFSFAYKNNTSYTNSIVKNFIFSFIKKCSKKSKFI